MSVRKAVKKSVSGIIKRELAPMSIVNINMREDENGHDGEPIYRIEVIFNGEGPHPERVSKMLVCVWRHLWDIDDKRFPDITFLTTEDAKDYYEPVALD